ncbi:21843_t:CDS:2 [Dentiscutata erythropus]|uniref:21843_t:CDS:1 n=2 Tax=Dentiscutata TaxID=756610 RepID=A0A9N9HG13_9GLOM|nr:21843_t:CDS:2 [Dentiscutata erythropus]
MTSSTNKTLTSQQELSEISHRFRQELVNHSNDHLSLVTRALSQANSGLDKVEKIVEDARDNIKAIERDLKSMKDLVFKLDPGFVPVVKNVS